MPGVVGTLQALEAIKLAAGVGQVLSQRLLIFDAFALRFQTVKLRGRWARKLSHPLQHTVGVSGTGLRDTQSSC